VHNALLDTWKSERTTYTRFSTTLLSNPFTDSSATQNTFNTHIPANINIRGTPFAVVSVFIYFAQQVEPFGIFVEFTV